MDRDGSSSAFKNTSIASSPVEPKTLSVMNARLSICLYAGRYRRCYRGHSSAHHRHRAANDIDRRCSRANLHRHGGKACLSLHRGGGYGVYVGGVFRGAVVESEFNAVCVKLDNRKKIHPQQLQHHRNLSGRASAARKQRHNAGAAGGAVGRYDRRRYTGGRQHPARGAG